MELPKVSVIIPVYNVEKYLEECLNSIVGQSLRDIEIICIDDGSPDRCPDICEQYAAKDSRVKVIHQENQGLSAARNTGIAYASGEYIAFIDSDDWIHPNYLEVLYRLCVDNDCLISQCSLKKVWGNDEIVPEHLCRGVVFSGKGMVHRRFEADGWKHGVTWCKLYHSSIFSEIRFPIGKIHEDEFTTYLMLWKAPRVAYTNSKLYYYRQRSDSIMSKGFSEKSLHAIEAYEGRVEFFRIRDHLLYQKSLVTLLSAISRIRKNAVQYNSNKDILVQLDEKYEKTKDTLIKERLPFEEPPPDYPVFSVETADTTFVSLTYKLDNVYLCDENSGNCGVHENKRTDVLTFICNKFFRFLPCRVQKEIFYLWENGWRRTVARFLAHLH